MKQKNEEINIKEIVGIFDAENLSVEVEGEIVDLSDLTSYDGCDIFIKLRKEL